MWEARGESRRQRPAQPSPLHTHQGLLKTPVPGSTAETTGAGGDRALGSLTCRWR